MFTPTEAGNLNSNGSCKAINMTNTFTHHKNHPSREKMVVINENNETTLKTNYSSQPICCPLRLNQLSSTTVGHPTSCNTTRTMNRKVGGNNMTATCRGQSPLGDYNNPSKILVTSNAIKMSTRRPPRLSSASRFSSYHLQLIQMVAMIVVISLVSPLNCLSDTQIAPTIPSLCPLVSSCLCKWSNGKISKYFYSSRCLQSSEMNPTNLSSSS